jgi:hypothetical protein
MRPCRCGDRWMFDLPGLLAYQDCFCKPVQSRDDEGSLPQDMHANRESPCTRELGVLEIQGGCCDRSNVRRPDRGHHLQPGAGREHNVCDGGGQRHGGQSVQAAQAVVHQQPVCAPAAPVLVQHAPHPVQEHWQRNLGHLAPPKHCSICKPFGYFPTQGCRVGTLTVGQARPACHTRNDRRFLWHFQSLAQVSKVLCTSRQIQSNGEGALLYFDVKERGPCKPAAGSPAAQMPRPRGCTRRTAS